MLVKTVCFIWFCSLFAETNWIVVCNYDFLSFWLWMISSFFFVCCRVLEFIQELIMLGLMVWSSVWIWTHLAQSEFNGSLSIVEIVNNLKIDFIWSNSYLLHCKESKIGDIRYLYAFKHVVVRQEVDSRFDHFKNKFLSQITSQYN